MYYGQSIVPKSAPLSKQIGAGKPVISPTNTVTLNVGNPQALIKLGATRLTRADRALRSLLNGQAPNNRPLQALNKVLAVDIGASAAKQGVVGAIAVSATSFGQPFRLTESQIAGIRTYRAHIRSVLGTKSTTSSAPATPVSVPPKSEGEALRQSMLASRPVLAPKTKDPRKAAMLAAAEAAVAEAVPTVAQAQSGAEAAAALTLAEAEATAPAVADTAQLGLVARTQLAWARTPTWGKIALGGAAAYILLRQTPILGRVLP